MTRKAMELELTLHTEHAAWKQAFPRAKSRIMRLCLAALNASKIGNYKGVIAISVVLSDDDGMRELNHTYRGKNKPTNVLAFPSYDDLKEMRNQPADEAFHLGDIVLSYSTIQSESAKQHKSFADHAGHLVVHGCLHLAGYDHETSRDAAAMEALEISVLDSFGIANPYKTPKH